MFSLVQRLGQVPWTDLEGTLNLGVGMVAIVAADAVDGVLAHAAELGLPAWELGTVRHADPTTDVVGAPGFVAGHQGRARRSGPAHGCLPGVAGMPPGVAPR